MGRWQLSYDQAARVCSAAPLWADRVTLLGLIGDFVKHDDIFKKCLEKAKSNTVKVSSVDIDVQKLLQFVSRNLKIIK